MNNTGSIKISSNTEHVKKAISMMIKGIYSNIIEAIVREISCNARDSHIEAGKQNVPLNVSLPCDSNNWIFSVEDFGLGLSKEAVLNNYITIFESDKQNKMLTGGFGLGSKTPWAYAEKFNIESVYNGTKYYFTATIEGEHNIVCDKEEPVNQSNGLKVILPVKYQDANQFVSAANKVYRSFDILPNIVSGYLKIRPECIMFEKEGIKVLHGEYNSGLFAVQSAVKYPIQYDILTLAYQMGIIKKEEVQELDYLKNVDAYFYFEGKEVSYAPSREHLQYDQKTVVALIDKIKKLDKLIREHIQQQLDECDTIYEKAIIVEDLKHGYAMSVLKKVIKQYPELDDRGINLSKETNIIQFEKGTVTKNKKTVLSVSRDIVYIEGNKPLKKYEYKKGFIVPVMQSKRLKAMGFPFVNAEFRTIEQNHLFAINGKEITPVLEENIPVYIDDTSSYLVLEVGKAGKNVFINKNDNQVGVYDCFLSLAINIPVVGMTPALIKKLNEENIFPKTVCEYMEYYTLGVILRSEYNKYNSLHCQRQFKIERLNKHYFDFDFVPIQAPNYFKKMLLIEWGIDADFIRNMDHMNAIVDNIQFDLNKTNTMHRIHEVLLKLFINKEFPKTLLSEDVKNRLKQEIQEFSDSVNELNSHKDYHILHNVKRRHVYVIKDFLIELLKEKMWEKRSEIAELGMIDANMVYMIDF